MKENDFEIRGGGFGFIFLTILSVAFWVILVMMILFGSLRPDPETVITLLGYVLICIFMTIINMKFRKSNFIKIIDKKLFISVMDRTVFRNWPKFNKKTIILCEIESVSLDKPEKIHLAPNLKIRVKNEDPYYIDTKPFSKASFWKLLKEFEKNNITVTVELGAI